MFSDLLNETKGFKYQITVEVLLKKYKHNGEIEFRPVYFNSVTKTVTNHIFKLENILKKFYTWLMFGLIMNLVGLLNELNINRLIFQLIDHLIWIYLLN